MFHAPNPTDLEASLAKGDLLDRLIAASTSTEHVAVLADGGVASANPAFADHVGVSMDDLAGRPVSDFLTAADAERLATWMADGPPTEPVRLNFVTSDGTPYTLRCLAEPVGDGLRLVGEPDVAGDRTAAEELMRLNNELATMARERARRQRELERTRQELEETLEELKTSYWHLQKIQEVLPVCMRCGKVKTDAVKWQTVAEYLKDNEIFLSHGYCPTCTEAVLEEHGLEAESTE